MKKFIITMKIQLEAESLEMAEARIQEVVEDDAKEMPGEWELMGLEVSEA